MKFWKSPFGQYVMNNLIAWDQLWNARTGGSPDETISSRLGKIKRDHNGVIPWSHPVAKVIDAGLDKIDRNHSIDAIEEDEGEEAVIKH